MDLGVDPLQHTSIYQGIKEDSDDSDGEGGMGNVNRVIMRPPGHSGKAKRGHLCFDASFETGNLGRVDLVNEYEYDLFIRPDTCNPKLRFWFNFTVDNVRQDQKVIFNIVNISKGRNLFNMKMTPIVKSSFKSKWQRISKSNVFYHRSPHHKNNYVLSFAFSFEKEDEVYQFALTFPYSYTRYQTFLSVLQTKATHLENQFLRDNIAESIQKRRLDVLTIGKNGLKENNEKRRVVVIIARIHPGESPSSLVCQGLIELLISEHPVAKVLRDNVLFKIIPMINPDGVYLGNYRSSFMGFDLNRSYHNATPFAHPTLMALIDLLNEIDNSKEHQLDFVLDIHAHSSLLGCFIYGNTYDDVYRYERHIVYPKLLANLADDYEANNSMFNADNNKAGTTRRFFCNTLGDKVNCYTYEVSFFGYKLKGSDLILPYTEDSYKRCGRNLLRAFLEYYHVTNAIPIDLTQELKGKRRPRNYRSRSATRYSDTIRPKTKRVTAPLHYKDININYDSETSLDEPPFSFRKTFTPRYIKAKTSDIKTKSFDTKMNNMEENEPSLSIIDFNIITKADFYKSKRLYSSSDNK